MSENLITPTLLAKRWNMTVTTLSQWRWNGRGPVYLKLGHRVMYRLQDIEAYEHKQLRAHTAALAAPCLR